MALKIPKLESDWDKVDPIHVRQAVILWCNVNPQDWEAWEAASDEIEKTWDLFFDGKDHGSLTFPTPADERRSADLGVFYADSDYYLTRKKLKSFAEKIGAKPLFLFQQKGKEKKYNKPPKPYEPKFKPLSWEYIKRADALALVDVFDMFYGKGRIANEELEFLVVDDSPRQDVNDICKLFVMGMVQGYFGDFVGRLGEYKKGCFGDLDRGLTPFTCCPLPTEKVFSFIQEKDITGLLVSYGYEIQPGFWELIEYFTTEEKTPTTHKPIEAEDFIKKLTFDFVNPYVFIREPNKRPIPYTLASLGFNAPDGVLAQDFISILNHRNGPCYLLGPSHSNLGSGGQSILDVGSNGEYISEGEENADGSSQISAGMHNTGERVEIPDYRKKKARLTEINKKLSKFIGKEFNLNLKNKFKLYKLANDKGQGEYQFKFQTKLFKAIDTQKFQSMDNAGILAKLKTFNYIGDEETTNEYMALCIYAIEKGIPEEEIKRCIKPKTR